jgi:hypothetical protein
MTGLPGGGRNQHALCAIIVDDQELQQTSSAADRRIRLSRRRLGNDGH